MSLSPYFQEFEREFKLTKLEVGIKAAIRSIVPILMAMYALVQNGQVVIPHTLSLKAIIAVISAMAAKGVFSAFTAKSVDIVNP